MSTQLCDFNMSTQFSVQEWGLQKKCNVIRFRGNRKHVKWDDIQDALTPPTAIFLFISDETIYLNKS